MPNNLTGQNISDTYQRLLQIQDGVVTDGTGSIVIVPSASYAISSSHEITYEVSSSYAETASYANNFTASGNISASGFIYSSGVFNSGRIYTNYPLSTTHFLRSKTSTNPIISATGGFDVVGNITASGNMSASGTGSFEHIQLPGQGTIQFDDEVGSNDQYIIGNDNNITIVGDQFVKVRAADHTEFQNIEANVTGVSINNTAGNITASGNISSSGNIFGSNLTSTNLTTLNAATVGGGILTLGSKLLVTGTSEFTSHITASRDISASGDIIANSYDAKRSGTGYKLDNAKVVYVESTKYHFGRQDNGTVISGSTIELGKELTTHVTASGNISASGNIYSDNIETVLYSYQLNNSATANAWYGPNSQGPTYYYWNKEFTAYPNTGLSHHTSGYVLPYKAELLSTRFVISCLSASPNAQASASLIVLSADDFSYPLEASPNSELRIHQPGNTQQTIDTQYGYYEISNAEISGSYPAGTVIYPRIKVTEDAKNWRGYWELRYRRIK